MELGGLKCQAALPRRAPASLHVGTERDRAEQSSWAAASQLNAAGAALALSALEHPARGSPGPLPDLAEPGDAGLPDQEQAEPSC